jgi:hypothetical protein
MSSSVEGGMARQVHSSVLTVARGLVVALVSAFTLTAQSHAADVGQAVVQPVPGFIALAPIDPANSFEARFGGFAHGIGSPESGTVDLNAEIVSPRLFNFPGAWSVLSPRIQMGVLGNLGGRTSAGYAGFLWTIPLFDRLFAEAFVGGAVHNGSQKGSPNMAALGCDPLFNVGGSLGYRFNERWSVMFTFDHMSNGMGIFGTNCGRNVGLNNYGARIGYAF